MRIPLVAIVGRPNVGKSRLFNRLSGSRKAIVENTPGVTRDRHYAEAEWYEHVYNLVDTGGFEPSSTDQMASLMRQQAQIAIDEADVVLVMFDGREGANAADVEIVDLMRRSNKRVFWVVNKLDGPRHDPLLAEFYELGLDPLFGLSAEHGRGVEDLMDLVTVDFPLKEELESEQGAEGQLALAVIGRPNVGKSTLINQMIGEERLLTSDTPGTTRDAIDTRLKVDGQDVVLIDTAGVRRRKYVELDLEKYSIFRAFNSIDRADVVLFLLDGHEGLTDQDSRLMNLVADKGRGMVLLINKWDIVTKDHRTADLYMKALREKLVTLSWVPIMTVSALTKQRVHKIIPEALRVKENWERRISTSDLNRFLESAIARKQPPVQGSRLIKLYYLTQVRARPPMFMAVCNHPEMVPIHYQRYLTNLLRESFEFSGTPIHLQFRKRQRSELKT